MVRNFEDTPVDRSVVDSIIGGALRAPSAGFTQGVDLVVPDQTAVFWDATTTPEWRSSTRRSGMLNAPAVIIPVCRPEAYASRYSEPDKAGSDLDSLEKWPIPYWWVDASFVSMLILLGATDHGLGAALLGMFRGEEDLMEALGVPAGYRGVAAILIGHPASPDPPSASLARGRRQIEEVVHRGRW